MRKPKPAPTPKVEAYASDQCPRCGGVLDGDSDPLTGSTMERCAGSVTRLGCGYSKRLNGRPWRATPEALAALAEIRNRPEAPADPAAPARYVETEKPTERQKAVAPDRSAPPTTADATSLGARLQAARTALNMSAELAAQRLGVAHSTYRTWEAGENRPRPLLWPRIRALFGLELTADDLPRGYKKLPAELATAMEPTSPAAPDESPAVPDLPDVGVVADIDAGTSAFPGEMMNREPVGAMSGPRTVELHMEEWAAYPETAGFTVDLLHSKGFAVDFIIPDQFRLSPELAKLLIASPVGIRA